MTHGLRLVYAGVPYEDRVGALFRREIPIEGLELICVPFHDVADLFRRVAMFAEFPVAEMSFASTARMVSNGDARFISLPVFPSRAFRHSQIYIRREAGINEPKDLAGRRIGVIEYEMTAAVWIRGLLSDDFGVDPLSVHWHTGGWEQPMPKRRSYHEYDGVRLTPIEDRALVSMLLDGDLDALIGPKAPSAFHDAPDIVGRLFPNYRQVEQEYYQRTGIFPMMHHVVIRREIYEENRWIAEVLIDAFARSKRYGSQILADFDKPAVMHPWIVDELESVRQLFAGHDPFAYGVSENRPALETLLRYCFEQRVTAEQISIDEIYAPEGLAWQERSGA